MNKVDIILVAFTPAGRYKSRRHVRKSEFLVTKYIQNESNQDVGAVEKAPAKRTSLLLNAEY